MIDIHFHWAWLLIAVVLIVGVRIAYPLLKQNEDAFGFSGFLGTIIVVAAILIGLVLGGIFIW